MLLIAIVAGGLLALVSVLFLALGLRGSRIDDHPVCRRCRFDLVGAYPGVAQCPECGHSLTERTVRIGRRRKRRVPIGVGVAGLMLVLAGIGSTLVLAATGFNWNTVKPTWMLLQESDSAQGATVGAAAKELARRVKNNRLGARELDRVVERALAIQADHSTTWNTGWGEVIGTAWSKDRLTDDQINRFLAQACVIRADARHRFPAGTPVPITIRIETRAGNGPLDVYGTATVGPCRVGDLEGEGEAKYRFAYPSYGAMMSMRSTPLDLPAGVTGRRTIDLPLHCDLTHRDPDGDIHVAIDRMLTLDMEIVDSNEPIVALITRDDLRATVVESVTASLKDSPDGRKVSVTLTNNPVGIAGQVLLVTGADEARIGYLGASPRENATARWDFWIEDGAAPQGATVVIRPDVDAAMNEPDIDSIWGEPITVPLLDETGTEGG